MMIIFCLCRRTPREPIPVLAPASRPPTTRSQAPAAPAAAVPPRRPSPPAANPFLASTPSPSPMMASAGSVSARPTRRARRILCPAEGPSHPALLHPPPFSPASSAFLRPRPSSSSSSDGPLSGACCLCRSRPAPCCPLPPPAGGAVLLWLGIRLACPGARRVGLGARGRPLAVLAIAVLALFVVERLELGVAIKGARALRFPAPGNSASDP